MAAFINGKYFIFKNRKAKEALAYMLCNNGGPVKNTVLAQILWPDAEKHKAMDSFYKVIRFIKNICVDGCRIPLRAAHGEVYLEPSAYTCDLVEFERFYQEKHDITCFASAVKIYEGPLLYGECFDWIAPYEAYYDIRFLEMAEYLCEYYLSEDKKHLADFYRKRIAEMEFSD